MKHCPECGDEFEDWVKECPDCHVDLLNGPKPVEEKYGPDSDFDRLVRGSIKSGGHIQSPNHGKLVVIASFFYPEEAYVVATKLQSEGIPTFITDDYGSYMDWSLLTVTDCVKIWVPESDARDAKKILDSLRKDV
jgi:hypothetical protein